MLQTATIVFREILEIALVLTIVLAATRGLAGRKFLVIAGLGIGLLGSAVIAFFTDSISQAIDGVGLEVFNASVMFIAAGFISWTVIWMKKHGRELAKNLTALGHDVLHGEKPLTALTIVVALSTFREGSEIVLFTYGMLASGAYSLNTILIGAMIGTAGGLVIGTMLYLGLLKTSKRHFFSITSWLLIFLTAGMAAQGANFLVAADVLPSLTQQVWDTSAVLSKESLVGQMLAAIFGYTPRPSGMELVFYLGALLSVGFAYRIMGSQAPSAKPAS